MSSHRFLHPPRRRAGAAWLGLALVAGLGVATAVPAAPQPPVAAADEIKVPEALEEFWREYREAGSDEAKLDSLVRTRQDMATRTLTFLLNEYCTVGGYELEGEMRKLAWSMDRTMQGGQERYIERVRLVTGLSTSDRRDRVRADYVFSDALALLSEARFSRDAEGLAAADKAFAEATAIWERIGDREQAVYGRLKLADVARLQERWDDMQKHLEAAVEVGEPLEFTWDGVNGAKSLLRELEKLRAGEEADLESDADEGSGRGLESYAARSEERRYPLRVEIPKKDMPSLPMPTFAPFDQDFSWEFTYVEGEGPMDFDARRDARWKPWGRPVKITRDGSNFGFDADGDGEADAELTITSKPQRLVLPNPKEDGDPVALMLAVPGDRETMFSADVNYSPSVDFVSRLRFAPGDWLEADVEGTTVQVFDLNITGKYGDSWHAGGDGITYVPDDDFLDYHELDAVIIGKAKRALPWSAVLPMGDGFWRAHVTEDDDQLVLREMKLDTGMVQLDMDTGVAPDFLVIRGLDELEGCYFDVVPAKRGGAVTVPAGRYEVACGGLSEGKKQGKKLARIYRGRHQAFTVEQDQTHVLELGAPYTLDVRLEPSGEETLVDTRTLRIFGRGGEEYAMLFNEPLLPTLEARTKDGKKLAKKEDLRPAGQSEWQLNNEEGGPDNILWFPLSVRLPNPKQEPVQVRIEQKKHKLLGGPIDSGWIPE